ncbi:MAG TPA: hypothetical protein VNY36_08470 [Bacteroidia bacterium]|jgi:hypothetical protein|nr:hypothetical protein [Bacteroidia bacterium]
MKNLFLFTLAATLLTACSHPDPNKQVDEGTVKGGTYHCNEIGWTIDIPNDWTITTKDKIDELDQKGKDAIEKTSNNSVDTSGLRHLINFQKDPFNMFSSTAQAFKEDSAGQYQQENKAIYALLYETFAAQGIKADTASGRETVQGMEFNTFKADIHGPNGDVIVHEMMYSRLINGYDFGVNINYNNDDDKKIMLDAFKNSKFDKNYPVR